MASGADISMRVQGFAEFAKRLERCAEDFSNRVITAALNAGAKPIIGAAKLRARFGKDRSGHLAESIGRVVRKKGRMLRAIVVIGPLREYTGQRHGKVHRPANIAHLIEYGYTHKGGTQVKAYPFLRPAFDERKAEAQAHIERVITAALNKVGM